MTNNHLDRICVYHHFIDKFTCEPLVQRTKRIEYESSGA